MLSVVVSGLAVGAIYATAALIYNLMYSTSRVLSVTTGHITMLGAVGGAWMMSVLGLPVLVALLGSLAVGTLFGLLTEFVAVRRVLNRSDEHLWLLSTLALATMTQQAVALWWGTEPRPFPRVIPQGYSYGIAEQKFWLPIGVMALAVCGLELFYRLTMWGKLFQATSEDALAARARGISTDQVRMVSYAMSGALGGLAGFAAGQLTFAYFALGLTLTLNGFIAIAVGGLGSSVGAVVGGLALGLLSAFATFFFGGQFQQTIAVGLLMIVLLVRPEGLFGARGMRMV
jgi:branched-chain amino acid transport system permease protein